MPSGPMERLRQLDDAFGVRIPALGRVRVIVQIAAHPHKPRTFREGEMAAHGWTRHVGVEFGQLCAIDEGGAPLLLDMGAAVEHIVRMGVRVAAEPEVDRARMLRQVGLERLRLRLVAKEVEIRGAFGAPSGP